MSSTYFSPLGVVVDSGGLLYALGTELRTMIDIASHRLALAQLECSPFARFGGCLDFRPLPVKVLRLGQHSKCAASECGCFQVTGLFCLCGMLFYFTVFSCKTA